MIEPVMAISNLVLTQQIYSEETTGAHAHYREPVPLIPLIPCRCCGEEEADLFSEFVAEKNWIRLFLVKT